MASKNPIEIMLECANILGNAAWLDLANSLVSKAKNDKDATPEDIDNLAELLILIRTKYIAEEAARKDPDMQERLRKIQKAAELVEASNQAVHEVKEILKSKNKDRGND